MKHIVLLATVVALAGCGGGGSPENSDQAAIEGADVERAEALAASIPDGYYRGWTDDGSLYGRILIDGKGRFWAYLANGGGRVTHVVIGKPKFSGTKAKGVYCTFTEYDAACGERTGGYSDRKKFVTYAPPGTFKFDDAFDTKLKIGKGTKAGYVNAFDPQNGVIFTVGAGGAVTGKWNDCRYTGALKETGKSYQYLDIKFRSGCDVFEGQTYTGVALSYTKTKNLLMLRRDSGGYVSMLWVVVSK